MEVIILHNATEKGSGDAETVIAQVRQHEASIQRIFS